MTSSLTIEQQLEEIFKNNNPQYASYSRLVFDKNIIAHAAIVGVENVRFGFREGYSSYKFEVNTTIGFLDDGEAGFAATGKLVFDTKQGIYFDGQANGNLNPIQFSVDEESFNGGLYGEAKLGKKLGISGGATADFSDGSFLDDFSVEGGIQLKKLNFRGSTTVENGEVLETSFGASSDLIPGDFVIEPGVSASFSNDPEAIHIFADRGFYGSARVLNQFDDFSYVETQLVFPRIANEYIDHLGGDISFNEAREQFIDSIRQNVEVDGLPLSVAIATNIYGYVDDPSGEFDPTKATLDDIGDLLQGNFNPNNEHVAEPPPLPSEEEIINQFGGSVNTSTSTSTAIFKSSEMTFKFEEVDGSYTEHNVDISQVKFDQYDSRISNFETFGTVIDQVSGTAISEGVQYNTVQTTRMLNGEVVRVTEYTLPINATTPSNGVVSKTVYEEIGENGQFYQKRVTNEVSDGSGLHEAINQREGDENSNWSFRVDTHTGEGDGERVRGDVFHVPSQDLQFALETAGGSLGSFLGNQLADGNKYQEIIYSSFLKTIGENFGSFASYLTGNSFQQAYDVVANGAPVEGTVLDDVSFSEDFFKNLNLKVSSVLGSVIFDEIGEALELDGFVGGAVTAAGESVTTSLVSGTIDVVFGDLDGTLFQGFADGSFLNSNGEVTFKDINGNEQTFSGSVRDIALNAIGSYAGSYLAGKVISPEDQTAGLLGSLGSAYGAAIANGTFLSSYSIGEAFKGISTAFSNITGLSWFGGPIGVAIGAFAGTVIGTAFGNLFGEEEVPQAWATVRYDKNDGAFEVGGSWSSDGGDASLASTMADQVILGVNEIINISQGKLRSSGSAPNLQIGYEGNKIQVAVGGSAVREFGTSADAIQYAAFKLMKDFDLVGGHMVVMRAWHNSDATNIYEWLEDIQVAEAFQNYLADPTAILALMMNEPDSDLAQSWAAILQRAAELELHLPHEKDLDGGWGEILLAQGVTTDFIPNIEGNTLTLTDPATGEERVLHHIIGPGYEIVRIEGTDGDDIIEVIVDGPSITYVNGGEGDDTIEGSDQADVLVGGTGDDIINGHEGNDWLHGGAGNDTLDGGAGEDLVVGGEQDDVLYGDTETDHVYGNGGNDQLFGNEGTDYLFGGVGDDILDGGLGNYDEVYGGEGDDTIHTGEYHHKLFGGLGDDRFIIDEDAVGNHIRIGRGEGHDVIEGKAPNYTFVKFSTEISAEELLLKREGDDLVIYVLGEDQSVTVLDYYGPEKPYIYLETYGGSLNAVLWDNASVNGGVNNFVKNHENIATPIGQYNVLTDAEIKVGLSGAGSFDVWRPGPDINGAVFLGDNNTTYTVGANENISTAMSVTQFGTYHALAHSAPRVVYGGAGNDVLWGHVDNGYDALYGDSGNDTIYGRGGNDMLVGGLDDDIIYGGSGNDRVFGGHGVDILYGGLGHDTIVGGVGDDTVYGEDGDDDIDGGHGNDVITGANGVDLIKGGEGQDDISGGLGNDTIHGGSGNDIISGDSGIDTIFGDEGDDIIEGGSEDDWISGGIGNDIIDSGSGNDTVYGGEGDDTFLFYYVDNINNENYYYGEDGNDALSLYFTSAEYSNTDTQNDIQNLIRDHHSTEYFNTSLFAAPFFNINFQGIENVNIYVDDIVQNIEYSILEGQVLDEELIGGNEDDLIFGDDGDDLIQGGIGDDFLVGGKGNDYLLGGVGDDRIYGGQGIDTISFEEVENYVEINLSENSIVNDGQSGVDYIENVENIIGSEHNDIIYDDKNSNIIYGGGGVDRINITNGRDIIYAGTGNDKVYTKLNSTGNHKLYGEEGNDYFSLSDNGKNYIDGGMGTNELRYSSSTRLKINIQEGTVDKNIDDTVDDVFVSIQKVVGGKGDDIILGSDLADKMYGSAGNDILKGAGGNDTILGQNDDDSLSGGAGDDHLNGENGDDLLSGQDGIDTLIGGNGSDIFIFEKATAFNDIDFIEDFDLTEFDQIDISSLLDQYDPNTDDITDFVQITDDGTDSFLSVDVGGTATNYVQIAIIKGITGLGDTSQLEADGVLITNVQTPLIVNSGPIAEGDVFAVEGTELLIGNVLTDNGSGADHDADHDVLSVVTGTITTSNGASVTIQSNGDFTYESASGFSGQDSFDYTLEDGNGGVDTGTVNITVTISNSNQEPQAQDDIVSGNEDEVIIGNVLADNGAGVDSDPDGDNISVTAETVATPNGGVVVLSGNGDFTYTPAENFNGTDSFTYTLNDSNATSSTGTVTVNVAAVNDAPTANSDSFSDNENQIITGNLIADNGNGSDLDLDGDSLSVVAETISSLNGGTVVIAENGDFSYTPASGFSGQDRFEYTLTDGNGEQAIGAVNITINEVLETINGTENNDVINGTEDSEIINGLGGHDDIMTGNGDDQVFGGAGNDEFFDQGGNDLYDGGEGTNDHVDYSESTTAINADMEVGTVDDDNDGQVDDSLIDIEWITATDYDDSVDGSSAIDRIYGGSGNDTIHGYASNDVLKGDGGNDVIHAGEGNDYIELGEGDDTAYGDAGNDTFHVTEGSDIIDGGEGDDTVDYVYHNSSVNVNLTSGTVDDNSDGIIDDTLVSIENAKGSNLSDVLTGNDIANEIKGNNGDDVISGLDGDDTLHGNNGNDLLIGGDGFDKLYGQSGADTFVFHDQTALNNVDWVEDFDFAELDQIDVSGMLNGYDYGVDDINNFVRFVEEGSHSYLEVDVDGTGASYIRIASLKNTINMPSVNSMEADNILITVGLPANNDPIAVNDNFTGDENQIITGNLIADNGSGVDSDPDGDSIVAIAETITTAQGGTVTIAENGDFTYTPATDFFGSDGFDYTLDDGNGGTATGSVSLTVNEVTSTNEINGTTGNDVINGTDGNDIINADAGNDNIYDGDGDDQVYGGAGNDVFYYHEGNDFYDGGEGTNDRINYINATQAAIFDLRNGTIDLGIDSVIDNTFTNIESVTATIFNDIIHGNAQVNKLTGLNGNDELYGYEGNDTLRGSEGDDIIYGGTGNDFIYGDEGTNTLFGEEGSDKFYVNKGNDTVDGGAGGDFVYYQLSQTSVTIDLENGTVDEGQDGIVEDTLISIEHAQGSNHDDIITGSNENNSLYGKNGNDVIYGLDGNDTIFGGKHDDVIYGQGGADKLYGQQDADTFVFETATAFSAIDQIMDFKLSENDKIDLSDLLNQFDDNNDNITDFVQITDDGTDSSLSVDVDGGANNFVQIATIKNTTGLTDEESLVTGGNLIV